MLGTETSSALRSSSCCVLAAGPPWCSLPRRSTTSPSVPSLGAGLMLLVPLWLAGTASGPAKGGPPVPGAALPAPMLLRAPTEALSESADGCWVLCCSPASRNTSCEATVPSTSPQLVVAMATKPDSPANSSCRAGWVSRVCHSSSCEARRITCRAWCYTCSEAVTLAEQPMR